MSTRSWQEVLCGASKPVDGPLISTGSREYVTCDDCKQLLPLNDGENVMVMTKIDDDRGVRNEQALCFHSRLFWTGCGPDAMYVYYTPTHWRLQ